MSRRLFLERVATLLGVGLAAPLARATPVPLERAAPATLAHAAPAQVERATPARPPVELQRSPVAGFQYHEGEAVWDGLRVGATLALVREPGNTYDQRAVRLDWQGRKLGYVPRIDNAAVSHLLDSGHALRAEIVALRASRNPWERVEVAVFLTDQSAAGGHAAPA